MLTSHKALVHQTINCGKCVYVRCMLMCKAAVQCRSSGTTVNKLMTFLFVFVVVLVVGGSGFFCWGKHSFGLIVGRVRG